MKVKERINGCRLDLFDTDNVAFSEMVKENAQHVRDTKRTRAYESQSYDTARVDAYIRTTYMWAACMTSCMQMRFIYAGCIQMRGAHINYTYIHELNTH